MRPSLPEPHRFVVAPVAYVIAALALVVAFLVDDPGWLAVAGAVVAVLGFLAALVDEYRKRVAWRRWDDVPAAAVAPHVDVVALTRTRTGNGELAAIKALRSSVPGVPLARARRYVAELTGVPAGR